MDLVAEALARLGKLLRPPERQAARRALKLAPANVQQATQLLRGLATRTGDGSQLPSEGGVAAAPALGPAGTVAVDDGVKVDVELEAEEPSFVAAATAMAEAGAHSWSDATSSDIVSKLAEPAGAHAAASGFAQSLHRSGQQRPWPAMAKSGEGKAGDTLLFRLIVTALEEHFEIFLEKAEVARLWLAIETALTRCKLTFEEVLRWRDPESYELNRLVKASTTEYLLQMDGYEEWLGALDAYWKSCKERGF